MRQQPTILPLPKPNRLFLPRYFVLQSKEPDMRTLSLPPEMREPPPLDSRLSVGTITRKYVLLINPFYPKDPHASFGKHVLTPSLALTSIAAATPTDWHVE